MPQSHPGKGSMMNAQKAMVDCYGATRVRITFARALGLLLFGGSLLALVFWRLNAEGAQSGYLGEQVRAMGTLDEAEVISLASVSLPIVSVKPFDLLEDGCKSRSSDQSRIHELADLVARTGFEPRGEARFVNKTFAISLHAKSGRSLLLLGASTPQGTAIEIRDGSKSVAFGTSAHAGLEHQLYEWITTLPYESSCRLVAERWYRDGGLVR